MASATQVPQSFAFIFPMASGHINPSLSVARALVEQGQAVHFLCRENMRQAIEDTGATFHSDIEVETELYEGREPDLMGAMEALKKEHGIETDSLIVGWAKLGNMQTEMMIPGVLRFLEQVDAKAVVYCPILNQEAAICARIRGIPSVGLLTTAGPGSLTDSFKEFMASQGMDAATLEAAARDFEPNQEAVRRMKAQYGLELKPGVKWLEPLGHIPEMSMSAVTLVTTSEDLQDSVTPELERKYLEEGANFAFVGPLLDKAGAKRAMTHKNHHTADSSGEQATAAAEPKIHDSGATTAAEVVAKVAAARAAGRRVVLVSMGTVVTGDNPNLGWEGRMPGADGQPRGLTGRELCHGAWGGAMDAFGAGSADDGPLLVVALGPQADPLGDLVVPPNAVCMPNVPQVDLLRAGIDVFLTHGGQNSFTESIAHATPVVVCPGFGDQVVNSRKAVKLGVGLKVDRPDPDAGMEAEAVAAFRAEVRRALLEVSAQPEFEAAAALCAQRLHAAGGVPRAVELVVAAAAEGVPAVSAASAKAAALEEPVTPSAVLAGAGA